MLKHKTQLFTMLSKIRAISLINIALITLLSASPILTNSTSNNVSSASTNNHPPVTGLQTPVSPEVSQSTPTGNTLAGQQPDTQEKNAILSLKTGRNLLKVVGIGTNLLILVADPVKNLTDYFIGGGMLGTTVALSESIVKDYKKPSQESDNTIRHAKITHIFFTLCKSIGIVGHGLLWREFHQKNPRLALVTGLSNLAFLGYGLYRDYKSYVANTNSDEKITNKSSEDTFTPAKNNDGRL